MSNKPQIKRLSVDLHNALQQVPLEADYDVKLALYSKILIEDYNWNKIEKYGTLDEVDALALGSRVTTSNNSIAVKHNTGWIIITPEGYPMTHCDSSILSLPVFSIPRNTHQSPDSVSLDDSKSTTDGTYIT